MQAFLGVHVRVGELRVVVDGFQLRRLDECVVAEDGLDVEPGADGVADLVGDFHLDHLALVVGLLDRDFDALVAEGLAFLGLGFAVEFGLVRVGTLVEEGFLGLGVVAGDRRAVVGETLAVEVGVEVVRQVGLARVLLVGLDERCGLRRHLVRSAQGGRVVFADLVVVGQSLYWGHWSQCYVTEEPP